jgi:hypothetical protein
MPRPDCARMTAPNRVDDFGAAVAGNNQGFEFESRLSKPAPSSAARAGER